MIKFLCLILLSISLNIHADLIDQSCTQNSCELKLITINPATNIVWKIRNKILKGRVVKISPNTLKTKIDVSYKKNSVNFQIIKTINSNIIKKPSQNDIAITFQNNKNTYIGISDHLNDTIISKNTIIKITDHIAKVSNDQNTVTITTAKGKSRTILIYQPQISDFISIQITNQKFTQLKTYIEGKILTNTNNKAIASLTLSMNNINIKINSDKSFKTNSKQKKITLKVKLKHRNNKTFEDTLTLENPLIDERFCEFDLTQNTLTAFCLSNQTTTKEMNFHLYGLPIGKRGETTVLPNKKETYTFIVIYNDNMKQKYTININQKRELNLEKETIH